MPRLKYLTSDNKSPDMDLTAIKKVEIKKKKRRKNKKLTPELIAEIKEKYKNNLSYAALTKIFGFYRPKLKKIIEGVFD